MQRANSKTGGIHPSQLRRPSKSSESDALKTSESDSSMATISRSANGSPLPVRRHSAKLDWSGPQGSPKSVRTELAARSNVISAPTSTTSSDDNVSSTASSTQSLSSLFKRRHPILHASQVPFKSYGNANAAPTTTPAAAAATPIVVETLPLTKSAYVRSLAKMSLADLTCVNGPIDRTRYFIVTKDSRLTFYNGYQSIWLSPIQYFALINDICTVNKLILSSDNEVLLIAKKQLEKLLEPNANFGNPVVAIDELMRSLERYLEWLSTSHYHPTKDEIQAFNQAWLISVIAKQKAIPDNIYALMTSRPAMATHASVNKAPDYYTPYTDQLMRGHLLETQILPQSLARNLAFLLDNFSPDATGNIKFITERNASIAETIQFITTKIDPVITPIAPVTLRR